jgi:biotin carboxyl carrier protein
LLEKEDGKNIYYIQINGKRIRLEKRDKRHKLLQQLGMEQSASAHKKEMKSPMPGLVLKILAKEGQHVKAGEPLLILEAMKMENVLKSPAEGIVREFLISEKHAVEKNQVLVKFE